MASYKRVLKAFGRSIDDGDFICNLRIHPWDIKIQKVGHLTPEKWNGNIRLVGFIDVFFLIAYQGESRFEQGIVIYKKEIDALKLFYDLDPELNLPGMEFFSMIFPLDPKATFKPRIRVPFDSDPLNYIVNGWGHHIALRPEFPQPVEYHIEIRREPYSSANIEKGLRVHTTVDLMKDTAAHLIVGSAEVAGEIAGVMNSQTLMEGNRRFMDGFNSKLQGSNVVHSASAQ
ncbi:hypothetical protein DFH27DRAFT_106741 [Peziza echinospora]|nr:hypothetical protein DFH27DRAFT_106741 [Peziza echinospora]